MFPSRSHRRRRAPSRRARLEPLEPRNLLAAAPLGATWKDTGEYMLGRIAVTVVFFESNGALDTETQNWTAGEIERSIDKVVDGVTWWSDLLDTFGSVHNLDFVFDTTFAETPFQTSYEPIDRPSTDPDHGHHLYLAEFLTDQGFGNAANIEDAIWQFNHAQREQFDTDWAFTVFVVDSSDDDDGLFAPGGFPAAFALPGGLYMVVPSERSASTVAHEMGHIFWAFDEYPGGSPYEARRGYYDTQNLNATDNNPDLSTQQPSIMLGGAPLAEAYNQHISAASTLALVGWQDSDGDGVFDVLDVPLALDATGYFDAGESVYRFYGTASAVPLPNVNSYGEHETVTGTNSDITLNQISELQYSLDDGPWITADRPGQQQVDFDLSLSINPGFQTIRWRAIDLTNRITSPVLTGTPTTPAVAAFSHTGLAFVDENANGHRDLGEESLGETEILIRRQDNAPLFGGVVDASDFSGPLPNLDDVTLTVEAPDNVTGPTYDPQLRSLVSSAGGGRHAFHAQELVDDGSGGTTEGPVRDRWSQRKFVAHFDQPVGEVSLDVVGLNPMTYGRLEAHDALGNLITRVTTEIGDGELVTLKVSDPAASISTIRAFGIAHTATGIAVTRLEYGFTLTATSDLSGVWTAANLPDGQYVAQLTPQRLIHQFDQSTVAFEVVGGVSDLAVAAALRVDSPRHNTLLPADSNQDGTVTARDALVIINDITRHDARILGPGETTGFDIDVNNDGSATALDALLVINHLNRQQAGESEAATDLAFRQFAATTDTTGQLAPVASEAAMAALWDSAGHNTPVESNVESNADTQTEPSAGASVVEETPVFAEFSTRFHPEDEEKTSESEENAVRLAPSFISIRAEMSEPLGRSVV